MKFITIVLAVSSVFLLALGQVLWKKGISQAEVEITMNNLLPSFFKLITNVSFVLGCIVSISSSIIWFAALSTATLNEIFPFFGLSFVFVLVLSWIMLHDKINALTLGGMLVISIGVFIGALMIGKGGVPKP